MSNVDNLIPILLLASFFCSIKASEKLFSFAFDSTLCFLLMYYITLFTQKKNTLYVQESLKPLQYIDINIDLRMQFDVLKCLIAITSVLNQYDKFIQLHYTNAMLYLA